MTLSAQLANLFNQEPIESPQHRLQVGLAATADEVRAAQRLRYRVFVEEMGARPDCAEPGIESDRFDPFCEHLIVRRTDTGEVVGCYRILTDTQSDNAGGFYSETEFDLTRVLALPGRFMEVGRTCVHPQYRNGATISLLWNGIGRFVMMNNIDYVMGCASVPLTTGTEKALMIYRRLEKAHLAPESWRTFPKVPLPKIQLTGTEETPEMPALLKGYLRVGAKICGEPAWDPGFNCADFFILLGTDAISRRYQRHFFSGHEAARR